MADDGVPPLDTEGEDVYTEGEDGEETESGDDVGNKAHGQRHQKKKQQQKQATVDEEDDEPPPPMCDTSDSEPEEPEPKKKAPAAKKKSPASSSNSAGAGSSSNKNGSSSGKAAKPPAAASSAPKGSKAMTPDPPLWTAFAKSRETGDRLGLGALHAWEAFEKEKSIPASMTNWYSTKVLGNKSVPQAPLSVPGLPSGFAEFCHWVADGHHRKSGDLPRGGFEAMAIQYVKRVKAAEGGARPPPTPPPSRQTSGGVYGGLPGGAAPASTARASAPSAEPIAGSGGGGGGNDPKARKRERRARKGGGGRNESEFVEKVYNVLAGLEGDGMEDTGAATEGGKPWANASGRASQAGAWAEAEISAMMRQEAPEEDDQYDAGEFLGPGFADSKIPPSTLAILTSLKRAKAFRRRSERQSSFLESELERCLGRVARMEEQYRAIVAETRGRECTLEAAIAGTVSLMTKANGDMEAGWPAGALASYDDAVKLLEVHVDHATGAAARESEDLSRARELLGLSLCNRCVANCFLGNVYNGQRDAVRAMTVWPTATAKEQLRLSEGFYATSRPKRPDWVVHPVPSRPTGPDRAARPILM